MSVKYKDNLIGTTWNIIDDTAPRINASYSSEKTDEVLAPAYEKLNESLAILKGVRAVVQIYADMERYYHMYTLIEGDIINVLQDETRNGDSTYYRYDKANDTMVYIGRNKPFYNKANIDALLEGKQNRMTSGVDIKTINGEDILGQGNIEISLNIDTWFPVGTIYQIESEDFDPNITFGGTWEKIEGRFIANSINTSELTYGAENVTLQSNQLNHYHNADNHVHQSSTTILTKNPYSTIPDGVSWNCLPVIRKLTSDNNDGGYDRLVLYRHEVSSDGWNQAGDSDWVLLSTTVQATATINSATVTMQSAGGGQPHNNMHPYLVVNTWHRIA